MRTGSLDGAARRSISSAPPRTGSQVTTPGSGAGAKTTSRSTRRTCEPTRSVDPVVTSAWDTREPSTTVPLVEARSQTAVPVHCALASSQRSDAITASAIISP